MLWVRMLQPLESEPLLRSYQLQSLQDTAGQEEFDAITKAYYRGAQACVLTFSTTDRCSFEAVKDWKKKVENECGEIPTVLVQNKIDMMDQTVVSL